MQAFASDVHLELSFQPSLLNLNPPSLDARIMKCQMAGSKRTRK
jgi:hypothetical protein